MERYHIMLKRGYLEEFCDQVTKNLNTDWAAQRMMGCLSHYNKPPMEEIVDEMLAILNDRNRIMQKKLEHANIARNEYLMSGLRENEEDWLYFREAYFTMTQNEMQWDKLLKIKTNGSDDSNSDQYHYPYEPTPYCFLERLVSSGYIEKRSK